MHQRPEFKTIIRKKSASKLNVQDDSSIKPGNS